MFASVMNNVMVNEASEEAAVVEDDESKSLQTLIILGYLIMVYLFLLFKGRVKG